MTWLLALLLAGSLALNVWHVDFGQPAHYDQCVDPVLPMLSLDAFEHVFGERHIGGTKYPRLHFVVVGGVQRAWMLARHGREEGARRIDALMAQFRAEQHPDKMERRRSFRPQAATIGELIVVGRVVSALMGMLCVLGVFLFAREIMSPAAALIAAAFVATTHAFVYYAHTLNVDVPYLMYGVFAFFAAARAVKSGHARWLVIAAVFAALSAGTKDQAGAWFVLSAPAVLYLFMRPGRLGAEPTRALPLAAMALALVAGLAVLAFANGLPFDERGAREHFAHIFGDGHTQFREHERTFAGHWLLLGETLLHVRDTLGKPLLALALLGALLLLVLRPALAALTLLPAASYYLTFIAPIGYVYLRFTLPIVIMLALAAAFALYVAARGTWPRRIALLAALALVAHNAWSSARMVAMMDPDPRAEAQAYLEQEAPRARIAASVAIPMHNLELPADADVRYLDQTTVNPGYGDDPPEYFVSSHFDPVRKLNDANPALLTSLPTMRMFARDYDLERAFAPRFEHRVRRGVQFPPRVLVYRRRARAAADAGDGGG